LSFIIVIKYQIDCCTFKYKKIKINGRLELITFNFDNFESKTIKIISLDAFSNELQSKEYEQLFKSLTNDS
jgi:hypothetical protein